MKRNGSPSKRSRSASIDLNALSDEELLDLRLCDLKLRTEGTELEDRIRQLWDELEARGIRFRPHFWFSDEWFSPDGVPGVAIPFYLGHERLMNLERRQMLEVEGGSKRSCMRILRHEAGHAVDTAYRLRRRKCFREAFGKVSRPYRSFYQPKPYSKNFVQHLDMWYAQAHPVEDFAETFAVWLRPGSRWKSQYNGWKALQKLQFVDSLMKSLREEKPRETSREHVEPIRKLRKTLRQHYREKRSRYGFDTPDINDKHLCRLFAQEEEGSGEHGSAVSFLNRARPELRKTVARWTGENQYTIDQVLHEMTLRCRELKLFLKSPEEETKRDAIVLVTVQTMNYLHGGRHRVVL